MLVARLSAAIQNLDRQIAGVTATSKSSSTATRTQRSSPACPASASLLRAEFLAATGSDMTALASADQLAGFAGLATKPRDSGKRNGNLYRPKLSNRQLQRVFYTSALISIQRSPASRTF